MLPYGDLDQICATGMVLPYGNGLIHSVPLRKNHLKVLVHEIKKDFANFRLPVPITANEVINLEDAVDTSIQWPRVAIVLTKVHIYSYRHFF